MKTLKAAATLLITLLVGFNASTQTIYEIQGQAAESPYKGQTVTTKGIVTAAFSNSYFIQDGDSVWTGFYIYDQTNKPNLGDSIQVTGTVEEYYSMTELKTITNFTVLSTGNVVPEPLVIKTGEASEPYESVLIKVQHAECTNANLGYGEWQIDDGSGPVVVNDLGVAFSPLLGVPYAVTGPLDYSFSFFKIEPRTLQDITQDLTLFFTGSPFVTNITKTGFDISWETNDEASAYIEYGLTPSFELGRAFSTASNTVHHLPITGLTAGEVYYAKSYSVNATNDTTPQVTGVYATQSESSGEIRNCFTPIIYEITSKSNATDAMVDSIISYIEKAEQTLDIAIYDLTNHAPQSDSSNYRIIEAINLAYQNGVVVRVISDDTPSNTALNSLNQAIPLLKGNSIGIMHNKFMVIDVESITGSWVVTGSVNWTYNNLVMDFNNLMCIQDQSLAKSYLLEFNEMWGSNALQPDTEASKFGVAKTDNTPHVFNINGTRVELYFSPSDNTTQKIVNAINLAESNVSFAMMAFTEDAMGKAIVAAHQRSIQIDGIIDYVEFSGSEFDYLLSNGVPVIDYANPDDTSWPNGPTLHNKYCIIDNLGLNPLVISGTHNWTASAESKNDENTLFIYNQQTADDFNTDYNRIKNMLDGTLVETTSMFEFEVYPNPSQNTVNITFSQSGKFYYELYDTTGKILQKNTLIGKNSQINIEQKGIYLLHITNNSERLVKKIIIL